MVHRESSDVKDMPISLFKIKDSRSIGLQPKCYKFTPTVMLSWCYAKAFFYGEDYDIKVGIRNFIIVWNYMTAMYI